MCSEYLDDLEAHEGSTTWLYCDVRGFVTIGIGNLVKTPDDAVKLPFTIHGTDGKPASVAQKRIAWTKVSDAYSPKLSAEGYRRLTDLRLSQAFVRELVNRRLERDFLPGIRRILHDFDSFPLPARKALVDMAYNLGVGGLAKFHKLIAACLARDWATAARECNRKTCRPMRNEWTAALFVAAVREERKA
jgi:GH24 family phage-related lysozyme (muramidase)